MEKPDDYSKYFQENGKTADWPHKPLTPDWEKWIYRQDEIRWALMSEDERMKGFYNWNFSAYHKHCRHKHNRQENKKT